MNCCHDEPSLIDALSDPIVQAVMTADGVDPRLLKASLRKTARNIASPARENERGR